MPKLWNKTIEAHRQEVQDAILEATAALVAERGLRGVTMSGIAEETGIGRATLYKYFRDVESILLAWHERQIGDHLAHLGEIRDRSTGGAADRLKAVLEGYASISHATRSHRDADLAAFLHRDEQIASARRRLHEVFRDLIAEGSATGELRSDMSAEELATYCLHALGGAGELPSKAAVGRLVEVTIDGLRRS